MLSFDKISSRFVAHISYSEAFILSINPFIFLIKDASQALKGSSDWTVLLPVSALEWPVSTSLLNR